MSKNITCLDEFVSAIGVDSFHLAGNSYGVLISFLYADAHPEKVGKLILVDAAGFPSEVPLH